MIKLYAILLVSAIVVMVWWTMAGYMIYQIGKDMNVWHTSWIYIDKWLKWRYGL